MCSRCFIPLHLTKVHYRTAKYEILKNITRTDFTFKIRRCLKFYMTENCHFFSNFFISNLSEISAEILFEVKKMFILYCHIKLSIPCVPLLPFLSENKSL